MVGIVMSPHTKNKTTIIHTSNSRSWNYQTVYYWKDMNFTFNIFSGSNPDLLQKRLGQGHDIM